ncbi:hypothetical protein [Flavilitoribacter nigricans]|uniref:Receptor L-domain domain-containing protein n=1 Tax=Flavilitoribacter nigricans (strain ATCC 23147 / DSM 23189 / NBRC 102662 / NCIMB 1420 / SS-2) TaxID=1122177 RepID=A0A2D0NEU3_FLAN2|nr:hypothetical protein [Flavilitoribacter nigricans]PHN06303.1 hypothetical protein CRP01_12075 [Flavilitoribacter nigricans DSM 23189 = NBRC 102662]
MQRPFSTSMLWILLVSGISFVACNKSAFTPNPFEGDVFLRSQAEVDEFGEKGYNVITGNLHIGKGFGPYGAPVGITDIVSLLPLREIISVSGNIEIVNNPELASLAGLSTLNTAGSIILQYNAILENIQALSGLESIENHLILQGNSQLASLRGLERITKIPGDLTIEFNPKLENFAGLENLESIGSLQLRDNESLGSIDHLESLVKLEHLGITYSPLINSLAVFKNITSLPRGLGLEELSALTSLEGLHNVESIGGFLGIWRTGLTSLEELSSLQTLDRTLKIIGNDHLTSLDGLENISSIGGYGLEISDNEALVSIEGLSNLHFVSFKFTITNNELLADFCPLNKLFTNTDFLNRENERTNIRGNSYNPSEEDFLYDQCKP